MHRFETFEDLEDKWRWRLIAANGRIVASSGETFPSHADALRAAAKIKTMAVDARVSPKPGVGFKALLSRLIRREEDRRERSAGGHERVASPRRALRAV
jgi:uncharacterized protein YegP (UPF0339 family)